MTIYEGTTGMQALDFLTRRLWREQGRGLDVFTRRVRQELGETGDRHPTEAAAALRSLEVFEDFSMRMVALQSDPDTALYEANSYMTAAWETVTAWMTLRLKNAQA